MSKLTAAQIGARRAVNEICAKHFENDTSGKELGGATPISFVIDHLQDLNLEGAKLVVGDSAFVYGLQNLSSLKDVWFFEHDGVSPELHVWIREKLGADRILSYNELMTTKLKFNLIVGNPPFNGKSSIHLKIVGRLEHVCAKGGMISLILPKPILVRQSDRCVKYTAWMDTCSTVEWHDIPKSDFPTVSDDLIWFTVKNDSGCSMVDLSVKAPITFKAKRVVGVDFVLTKKIQDQEYSIPLYSCMGSDGVPKFNRYTKEENLSKIKRYFGKPILHVNLHGNMIRFNEIAWLDEAGEHGWFRQGIDSFVFSTLPEARRALKWFQSDARKKYVDECLSSGWLIRDQIQALFEHKT
jgi:hypothetical protein